MKLVWVLLSLLVPTLTHARMTARPCDYPIEPVRALPDASFSFLSLSLPSSITCPVSGEVYGVVSPEIDGERTPRIWQFTANAGPHNDDAILDRLDFLQKLSLNRDGKTASVTTTENIHGESNHYIIDLKTGEDLSTEFIQETLVPGQKASLRVFSDSGRFSVWEIHPAQELEGKKKEAFRIFDSTTRKVVKGPEGFDEAIWINNEGNLFLARPGSSGEQTYSMTNLEGKQLYSVYAKPSDISISESSNGRTLMIATEDNSVATIRLFELPLLRLKKRFSLSLIRIPQLSKDGNYVTALNVATPPFSPVIYSAVSGKLLAKPGLLQGYEILPCNDRDGYALTKNRIIGGPALTHIITLKKLITLQEPRPEPVPQNQRPRSEDITLLMRP